MKLPKTRMMSGVSAAVIYLRVSHDPEGREQSLTRHRTDCRALCERNGWTVVEECVDNDISASRYSRKRRPGWARVLELVEAGTAERIVAWDLDRMMRQPRELEDLIDRAEKGLPVTTLSGDIRLDTADGRFISRILVAKAAKESDDLSRRIKRQRLSAAQAGRPLTNIPAFGWDVSRMEIVEEEAEAIRDAARRVLAGEIGVTGLAREWTAKGYRRPRSAKQWSSTSVRGVLVSPRNAGLAVYQREVIGDAVWAPILDRLTYERLLRLFADPSRKKNPRRVTTFTGVFRCGHCGAKMSKDQVAGKVVWRCKPTPSQPNCGRSAITGTLVEEHVVESLFELIDASGGNLPVAEPDSVDEAAVAELAAVEARQRELAAMFAAGEISRAEWLAAREPLTALQEAASQALKPKGRRSSVVTRWAQPGALREAWPAMTDHERNSILREFYDGVIVHPATPDRRGVERLERRWRV